MSLQKLAGPRAWRCSSPLHSPLVLAVLKGSVLFQVDSISLIRLASGQGRVKTWLNHPRLIHKSTNRFFTLSLFDLSSIPHAREGAPGSPPAPKSDRKSRGQWSSPRFGRLLATLLESFSVLLAILGLHLLFLSLLSLPFCDFSSNLNLLHLEN